MSLRRTLTVLACSTAVLLTAVQVGVRAQNTPPDAGPIGLGDDEDLASQPSDKLVDKASGFVKKMEEWLTDSFWLLEASLSAGDVNGANSRNEAITVMKGLVKLSE